MDQERRLVVDVRLNCLKDSVTWNLDARISSFEVTVMERSVSSSTMLFTCDRTSELEFGVLICLQCSIRRNFALM